MYGTPKLLSEVSKRTNIEVRTLQRWAIRGEGPKMFKLGHRWMAYDVDVDRWLQEQYERAGGGRDAAA